MKLWGGRFADQIDASFEKFSESFSLDQRLIHYDLRVNLAYVKALGKAGALHAGEVRRLSSGLEALRRYVENHPDWARGQSSEDVHTWVEERLEHQVGSLARKLRTGRSRNDLIATEMRLFVKDSIVELGCALVQFLDALVRQARRHSRLVMPGTTHLQPAQPILFSHYLLAYFEMLLRDASRLEDCRSRADELPLGAGALAGTSFHLDRAQLAGQLGFRRVARNSVDVTSDRDFIAELLFDCALIMTHLSRIAEDLVIYSTPAFGYVELADAYSTGSSLMPQKKNPDSLELIRGKAARSLGNLASLLMLLKGLPLAYNRDLQEDKSALFDTVDTTRDSLQMAARVIEALRVNAQRMRAATSHGFLTATDVAEELVRRGMPFAQAHEQVGKLVRYCIDQQKTFAELSMEEGKKLVPCWDAELQSVAADPEESVKRRKVVGGTAPAQVARQIALGERAVARLKQKFAHPH